MQLPDYLYPVYLSVNPAHEYKSSDDSTVLNLDKTWRAELQKICEQVKDQCMPGLLFLQQPTNLSALNWSIPDYLLEHLESHPWDLLYLSYATADETLAPHVAIPHAWERCDMPPARLAAMALRCDLVTAWLDAMPDRAQDGPFNIPEWFSISSWLAAGVATAGHTWAMWPPLNSNFATVQPVAIAIN
jgi:hypothetical protein